MQDIELDASEKALWREFEAQVRRSDALAESLPSAEELKRSPTFVAGVMKAAFAEAVWQGMKRKRLSPAALARKLGVSRQAVSEVLAMKGDLRLSTMARLSVALDLGLDLVYLRAWADPIPASQAESSCFDSDSTTIESTAVKADRSRDSETLSTARTRGPMSAVIELVDFAMRRLQVLPADAPEDDAPKRRTVQIAFHHRVSVDDPGSHLVHVRIKSVPGFGKAGALGPLVEAEIGGLFKCPEDLHEDRRSYMALFNGSLILYGILRGQIASMTGTFPGGAVKLPSVDMKALVDEWIAQQAQPVSVAPKRRTRASKTRA